MKPLYFVLLAMVISSQGFAQYVIRPSISNSKQYWYHTNRIDRVQLQALILDSGDCIAISYWERSETQFRISDPLITVGRAFLIAAFIEYYPFYMFGESTNLNEENGLGLPFLGVGLLTFSAGIIFSKKGKKQIINSIDRFNSIQKSKLTAGFSQKGLGLIYHF